MASLASNRRSFLRLRNPFSGGRTRNILLLLGCLAYASVTLGLFSLRPLANEGENANINLGSKPNVLTIPTRLPIEVVDEEPSFTSAPYVAPEFTVTTGSVFEISLSGFESRCLTISGSLNAYACRDVTFTECRQTSSQAWQFGTDRLIRNPSTNHCLDVYRSEDNLHACGCHGQDNQQFSVDTNALRVNFGKKLCISSSLVQIATVTDCVEARQRVALRAASWFKVKPSSPFTPAKGFSSDAYEGVGSEGVVGADGVVSFADAPMMDHVRGMMTHSWENYVQFAWGADELRPLSRSRRNWLGPGLAATIVDSLDTLYIMGLHDEYNQAVEYVRENLSFDVNAPLSFFETTIRDLGGLLAAYSMTGDKVLLDKAVDLGNRMLPAFDTATRMPHAIINLHTGASSLQGWAGSQFILAEVGTVQLEFKALSHYSGDPKYAEKAMAAMDYIFSLPLPDKGMYPVFLGTSPGTHVGADYTLGGLSDSFYEYLIKQWVWTNKTEPLFLEKYLESVEGVKRFLVNTANIEGRDVRYVGKYKLGQREYKMEHLACFSGGMIALGANSHKTEQYSELMDLAADLVLACRLSYINTKSGLGPEKFGFSETRTVPDAGAHYYILRPEYVESLFYMWRYTKDVKYRQWGYDVIQALDRGCRLETGYSGLENINNPGTGYTDIQESFFLAETLKYLYLLFADDTLLPLDEWVFNTEAHPLPVIGKTPPRSR